LTDTEGVAQTMCRRFDRNINSVVSIDESGRGDWRDLLPDAGLKVVGYVQEIFRAC
jgi:predicted secreted protein